MDLLLKTACRWKEVHISATQMTASFHVKLQENGYLYGKGKPFTIKKIKVPGWVNTWSSGFHGEASTAETDAPMASFFFLLRYSFTQNMYCLLNFNYPCLRFTVMGDVLLSLTWPGFFGGGQQPCSSPDWPTCVNIPIPFFLQPCYFNQSFPWQTAE